jgi:hydroxypyruvate reductase
VALGKAAPEMASVAVDIARERGTPIGGGIVVGGEASPTPHPSVLCVAGDHPVPGARSLAAADAIATTVSAVGDDDIVLVLISGGATSLAAAPADGLDANVLPPLFDALLRSGWDIGAMNLVRKRFLRWGAGRLATALAPAVVQPAILSDVIGDDPAFIASGPCAPDPLTARDVRDRLHSLGEAISRSTLASLTRYLDAVHDGRLAETPKAGDPAFESVRLPVVHGNTVALDAAAARASELGWSVLVAPRSLAGEASTRGTHLAEALLAGVTRIGQARPMCLIHGGETTVTVGSAATGNGGRCQELALAAARTFDASYESAESVALLAAGTDGRDGPTDAAGAVVDRDSWRRARAAGRDPAADLARHDSHAALDAAGALVRTGPTGTNVMDVVVGLVNVPA